MAEMISIAGLDVPREAFEFACRLESSGIVFSVTDGKLTAAGRKLTDEERTELKRWKGAIIGMVTYDPQKRLDEVEP